MNDIRIEPHQIRRVRRADFRHTGNAALLQLGADGHALEESLKRHFLVDLGEDVLIAAEGITDRAHLCSYPNRTAAGSGSHRQQPLEKSSIETPRLHIS